jgi:hypothetical protein
LWAESAEKGSNFYFEENPNFFLNTFSTHAGTDSFFIWPNNFKKVIITMGPYIFLSGRIFPSDWPERLPRVGNIAVC